MQLQCNEIVVGVRQSYVIGCTEKKINYLMDMDLIWLF
jgi:hypothetical protein